MTESAWFVRIQPIAGCEDAADAAVKALIEQRAARECHAIRDDLGALLLFDANQGSFPLGANAAPAIQAILPAFGQGAADAAVEIVAVNRRAAKLPLRYALYVSLEARAGKEEEVARFLREAQPLIDSEPYTLTWYGLRRGRSHFAIIDFFETAADRDGHRAGKVAGGALMRQADALFIAPPHIRSCSVLASAEADIPPAISYQA